VRNRITRLVRVKASDLAMSPHNFRQHSFEQMGALTAMLERVGFAGAALARQRDDGKLEVIDGHLRAQVAGDNEIPVLVLDVDERDAKTLLATLDPLAAMAETDVDALTSLVEGMSFDDASLTKLIASLAPSADSADSIEADVQADIGDALDDTPERSFVFIRRKRYPASDAELYQLWVAADWFLHSRKTLDGFVSWLLEAVPAADTPGSESGTTPEAA